MVSQSNLHCFLQFSHFPPPHTGSETSPFVFINHEMFRYWSAGIVSGAVIPQGYCFNNRLLKIALCNLNTRTALQHSSGSLIMGTVGYQLRISFDNRTGTPPCSPFTAKNSGMVDGIRSSCGDLISREISSQGFSFL